MVQTKKLFQEANIPNSAHQIGKNPNRRLTATNLEFSSLSKIEQILQTLLKDSTRQVFIGVHIFITMVNPFF